MSMPMLCTVCGAEIGWACPENPAQLLPTGPVCGHCVARREEEMLWGDPAAPKPAGVTLSREEEIR